MSAVQGIDARLGGPIPAADADNEAELAQALATPEPAPEVATQLQLPGATVTAVGVDIVGPIDPDRVLAGLGQLRRTDTWTRWAVGDLFAALVAHHDGDAGPAYVDVAGLGYEPAWLNRSALVAQRVPHAHRRAGLSWSHHVAVAVDTVPVDQQPRWLGLAVANRWTARQLEAAITAAATPPTDELPLDDPGEHPPAPKLGRDVVAAIFEAADLSPSGWVKLHPQSGQVLTIEGPA